MILPVVGSRNRSEVATQPVSDALACPCRRPRSGEGLLVPPARAPSYAARRPAHVRRAVSYVLVEASGGFATSGGGGVIAVDGTSVAGGGWAGGCRPGSGGVIVNSWVARPRT